MATGGGWRPGARWARDGALPATGGTAEAPAAPPPVAWSWGRPMILIARAGQRDVVTATCPLAAELGLRPGMAAAHARALAPDLDVRAADPDRDRAALHRLALHAVRHWTPIAGVAEPDGLWLDLTGTTHLFGGEALFCRRVLRLLHRIGYRATIAVAGTPGAAHALARYGGEDVTILPPGGETQAIAGLPLAALRLTPDALTAAARFGLERIADLYPIARGPLAKRLGLATVTRLDQARGSVAEPIVPVVPFDTPQVGRRLLEPIGTAEAIGQVIGDLVDDMAAILQARGLGLRRAVLACIRVDGAEQRIGLGTARATRDAAHLKRMFARRIERIEPGMGIEAMTLAAPGVEDVPPAAIGTAFADDDRPPDLAPLIDQLSGRVGAQALFRAGVRESDVPERAVRRVAPLATPAGWPRWPRPARLLRRPERLSHVVALLPDHPPRRFLWRGKSYRVVAGDGPERIHGEWWRNAGEAWAVRDYFRVEAEGGARFWLFRHGDGVDAATGDLGWYMHGLFG